MRPLETQSDARLLVIMRHAKAEPWGESDHSRRLAEQGVADAKAAGRWLAGQGFVPDLALVSGATRTQETWAAVSDGATWSVSPVFDDALYSAGPDTALDLIREAPAEARSLLVIGHNPTVAYLAHQLDDGEGAPTAIADMTGGYPTSAMTVLSVSGNWSDLESASVIAFHVGRA